VPLDGLDPQDHKFEFVTDSIPDAEQANENLLKIKVSNPDTSRTYQFRIEATDLEAKEETSKNSITKDIEVRFVEPKISLFSPLASSPLELLEWKGLESQSYQDQSLKIFSSSSVVSKLNIDVAVPSGVRYRLSDSPETNDDSKKFLLPEQGFLNKLDLGNNFDQTAFATDASLNFEVAKETTLYLYIANDPSNADFDSLIAQFTIVPPSETLKKPVITRFKTGLLRDFESIAEADPATIYGGQAMIELSGQNATPGGELRFFLVPDDKVWSEAIELGKPLEVPTDTNPVSGTWNHRLVIDGNVGDQGNIYVIAYDKSSSTLSFSKEKVDISISAFADPVAAPVISRQTGDSSTGPIVYRTKESELEISGTGGKAATEIGVFTPESSTQSLGKKEITGDGNWTIQFPTGEDGVKEYVIRVFQGEQQLAVSSAFMVDKRASGFTVESVQPESFGTSPGVTQLRVTFPQEHPLNPTHVTTTNGIASAKPGLFFLTAANGDEKFLGVPSAADTAIYEKASNSVLLSLNSLAPDLYQVRVSGTLTDIFGNQLEGVEDRPGTTYSKIVGRAAAKTEPAPPVPTVARGISGGATGAYVPYPDFVEPSEPSNGFNPSDKVETRVARLYFYRDAHRVAQIINRKVKSHNRQGADTQQQLADQARIKAEQFSFARQTAEQQAIVLAQTSRQKENELRRAQNSVDTIFREITVLQRQIAAGQDADEATKQNRAAQLAKLQASASSFSNRVNELQAEVQGLRAQEVSANELVQKAQNDE
ncbi:MAG: hypothetical protein AAF623_21635, partial [Planctomycetota bacterium]